MFDIETFQKELETEAGITHKMLKIVPADKFDWKPHPKSMSIRTLATHLAELPGWVTLALTTDELDFAKGDYKPTAVNTTEDLLAIFEKELAKGFADLAKATPEQLKGPWVLRNGETILVTYTKAETILHSLKQTIHHRAQLGVFLRLLDIPIPGTYGPSADDQSF